MVTPALSKEWIFGCKLIRYFMQVIQRIKHPRYEYTLHFGLSPIHLTRDIRKFRAAALVSTEMQSFKIEEEGFWGNQLLIRESDQVIGRTLSYDWSNQILLLDVHGKTYDLVFSKEPLATISCFDDEHFLFNVGLVDRSGTTLVQWKMETGLEDHSHATYLIAVVWYLFLPAAQTYSVSLPN